MKPAIYIETDNGVTASVGDPTPARLIRLAEACLRHAARMAETGGGPEDPDYLRDYLETTADGLDAEARLLEGR